MSAPADLAQFGHWLARGKISWLQTCGKSQSQELLVKTLCDALKGQATLGTSQGPSPSLQYRLRKLTSEDGMEAFLYAFEAIAIAAGWPKTQWGTILGPYLTGPAQVVLDPTLLDPTPFRPGKLCSGKSSNTQQIRSYGRNAMSTLPRIAV